MTVPDVLDGSRDRFAAPLVFALLLAVYMLPANWAPEDGWNDTVAASVGAHQVATNGTPSIENPDLASRIAWLVEDQDGAPVPYPLRRDTGCPALAACQRAVLAAPGS